MLVISRRKGERISIGSDIEIVVTDVTRKGVRLGIVAPKATQVVRGEVRDAVEQANKAAANSHFGTTDPLATDLALGSDVNALAAMGVSAMTLGDGAEADPASTTSRGAATTDEATGSLPGARVGQDAEPT